MPHRLRSRFRKSTSVTYAAFHARSSQLARALARLGVGRGDRVAVMAPNRAEYPIIHFAVLKLGAIVVPVNARFTASEVVAVVGHAEAAGPRLKRWRT